MKSKRVEQEIVQYEMLDRSISPSNARHFIEVAEEDAFERAKDAVRKGCIHYRENRACGIGIYCVKDIDCFQLNNFISHYGKAK